MMAKNPSPNTRPLALYFHWPFCKSKCPYCDFNVHVAATVDHGLWRAAFEKSIEHHAALLPGRHVSSIFFGGGTPSLMEPQTVQTILAAVKKHWRTADDIEITLEANPTSFETEKFHHFRAAGINRVSLGVQSILDESLKFLGRTHDAAQAINAIQSASEIFDRVSFDLIYARPNQTLDGWRDELQRAIAISKGHLSLYQLTIERRTPFYFDHAQGKFSMPDEGLSADMYLLTRDITASAGLPAYEVSNHAAPGHESRHNMVYWRYGDYAGIGPGAHGRLTLGDEHKYAVREHAAPDIWLTRTLEMGHARTQMTSISQKDRAAEALITGLRLIHEGVPMERIAREAGADAMTVLNPARLGRAVAEGWVTFDGTILKTTREGLLRLNALIDFLTT